MFARAGPPKALFALLSALVLIGGSAAAAIELEVLAPDNHVTTDPNTGVELTYLTWASASINLYFHQRSFFPDGSLIVFTGSRGLMGYIVQTGELVVLDSQPKRFRDRATVAATRNSVFAIRGDDIIELSVALEMSQNPATTRSRAIGTERVIARVDGWCSSGCGKLNGNYDDTYLVTYETPHILRVNVNTGDVTPVAQIGPPIEWGSHVQWSRGPSNLISFAGGPDWHGAGDPPRLWWLDPDEGTPRIAHEQMVGELVTHESWWGDSLIIYNGAPPPIIFPGETYTNDLYFAHVNVLNPFTGEVRVLGAGSWHPCATSSQLAKRNWLHCAGSDDGQWVVADTFHGDIVLFDSQNGRPRLLTGGHRVYGGGEHPHPSFDPTSRYVVFTGRCNDGGRACVARIPDEWRRDWTGGTTGLNDGNGAPGGEGTPSLSRLSVAQNAPNPFNPSTTIRWNLETAQHVRIDIYTVSGQHVRTLVEGCPYPAGQHAIAWDGADASGRVMGSGVYIGQVLTDDGIGSGRMTLVR